MRHRTTSPAVVLSVLAAAALAVPATTAALPSSAAGVRATLAPSEVLAVTALESLAVKGRAPSTGYSRAQFGQAWADTDRNGCDTRNDVLRRDLRPFQLKAGTHGCLVLSGTLRDPYTTTTIAFVRGADSARVQVDHVVALSDAWQKGAQGWSAAKRVAFANDGLNLLAVDGPTNQRKGAGDAATWLPPAKGYRCAYVARQVSVKRTYGLWVTAAERAAMQRVLSGCSGQHLVVAQPIRLGGGSRTAPVPTTPPTPTPESTVYYANCAAVRAAGAAPIRPGDPGWSPRFDGAGDGVGCE